MPKISRTIHLAFFVAASSWLLPLSATAAQQEAPRPDAAAGAATPPTGTEAAANAQRTAVPQPDPRSREKDLGLMPPANPALPSLVLIGDSTVRNGHGRGDQNQWGWGAPLADLFDPAKINVVNRAIGGLSSHSYISEGHWDLALEIIKPGDFVLIQWGHNDGGIHLPGTPAVPDQGLPPGATPPSPPAGMPPRGPNVRGSLPGIGPETYEVADPRTGEMVTVHTYGWYLRKYIADVKAKGATPIICSLVPRKIWVDGHIRRNTDTYRGWAPAGTRWLRRPERDDRPPLRRHGAGGCRRPFRRPAHAYGLGRSRDQCRSCGSWVARSAGRPACAVSFREGHGGCGVQAVK